METSVMQPTKNTLETGITKLPNNEMSDVAPCYVTRSKSKPMQPSSAGGQTKHGGKASSNMPSSKSLTSHSSRISQGESGIAHQLESQAWVQCEHLHCLKWRRINRQLADGLGAAQWFCSMNEDVQLNSCEAPEEDYRAMERLVRKFKLKYVISALESGALVWAKMFGYCRWPAVVSPDPASGEHIHLDKDGDPLSYHVEYLGNSHSHGWVRTQFVEPYGQTEGQTSTPLEGRSENSKEKRKFPRKKQPRSQCSKPRQHTRYKGDDVQRAMAKANSWLDLTPEERLSHCSFTYTEGNTSAGKPQVQEDICTRKKRESNRVVSRKRHFDEIPTRQKSTANAASSKQNGRQPIPTVLEKRTKETKKTPKAIRKVTPTSKTKAGITFDRHSKESNEASCEDSDNPDQSPDTSPSIGLSSPMFCGKGSERQLAEKLGHSVPLQGRTKEEKFTMDLETFQRNQQAFDHDVHKFLATHGRVLKRLPCWQNVTVIPYQLFLAVYDRGGYDTVSQRRQWINVFREVTSNFDMSRTTGSTAKHFYERYLLPYELYLRGERYKHLLPQQTRDRRGVRSKGRGRLKAPSSGQLCPDENEILDDDRQNRSEGSGCDVNDLHKMVDAMQEIAGEMPDDFDMEELLGGDLRVGCDLKLQFYDDHPAVPTLPPDYRVADTASEFGCPNLPGESAQEVPNVLMGNHRSNSDGSGGSGLVNNLDLSLSPGNAGSHGSLQMNINLGLPLSQDTASCNVTTPNVADDARSRGSSDGSHVLHEMKALQQEMEEYGYDLDCDLGLGVDLAAVPNERCASSSDQVAM